VRRAKSCWRRERAGAGADRQTRGRPEFDPEPPDRGGGAGRREPADHGGRTDGRDGPRRGRGGGEGGREDGSATRTRREPRHQGPLHRLDGVLPRLRRGANFALGDFHASQGRRRITFCGAIEMAGYADVEFDLVKNGMEEHGVDHPIFEPGHRGPNFEDYITFCGYSVTEDGEQRYIDSHTAYRRACLQAIDYLKSSATRANRRSTSLAPSRPRGVRAASSTSRTRARRWRCRRASSSSTSPRESGQPSRSRRSCRHRRSPLSDRSGRPSDCRRGRSRPRQRARSEMAGARSGMTRARFRAERGPTPRCTLRCDRRDTIRYGIHDRSDRGIEYRRTIRRSARTGESDRGDARKHARPERVGQDGDRPKRKRRRDKHRCDRSRRTGDRRADRSRDPRCGPSPRATRRRRGPPRRPCSSANSSTRPTRSPSEGCTRPRSSTGTPARPRTPVTPSTSSASRSIRTTSGSARSRRRRLPDAGTRRRPGGSLISPLTRSARSTSTPPGSTIQAYPGGELTDSERVKGILVDLEGVVDDDRRVRHQRPPGAH